MEMQVQNVNDSPGYKIGSPAYTVPDSFMV